MKVGDMVQYVAHASWVNKGLGVLTDVQPWYDKTGRLMKRFQVTWLDDIEEFGWDGAIGGASQWYDDLDTEDIKLFAEAE